MGALTWDLVASGELLEKDSDTFPHATRYLYLVGYIILATTVLNFLSEVKLQTNLVEVIPSLQFFDHFFDHVPWVLLGMTILGIPSRYHSFLYGYGTWKALFSSATAKKTGIKMRNREGIVSCSQNLLCQDYQFPGTPSQIALYQPCNYQG